MDDVREPKLIVYSVGCSWWSEIENVGISQNGVTPCCPYCGSVLYEVEKKTWWKWIEEYDAKHHGYFGFMKWSKDRCFMCLYFAELEYKKRKDSSYDPVCEIPDCLLSQRTEVHPMVLVSSSIGRIA